MQLSAFENVTPENVKFTDAKEFKVKDSNIKYKRIPIEISYGNNKKGPLVIETPALFSFGVSEKKNQETKKLVGYSVPVCPWEKDSQPNEKQQAFFDVINNITSITTSNDAEKRLGHLALDDMRCLMCKESKKHLLVSIFTKELAFSSFLV